MQNSEKIVIGLTGPFGSGCTYIAKNILSSLGYKYISLSDILKEYISEDNPSRTDLQNIGNKVRNENGNNFLALKAIEKINNSNGHKFIVDSIRNTHEIDALKSEYSSFFLFAIWANKDIRWNRSLEKYSRDLKSFETDDKRDTNEKIENGQQITLCYQMADIIILNQEEIHPTHSDDFNKLKNNVKRYTDIIEGTSSFKPTEAETLMTVAYANSMRSSCLQRKVGALIIDEYGNIFSSGYNEVPSSDKPCMNIYGKCYRKFIRESIDNQLKEVLNDEDKTSCVSDIIKKNSKMLDYCRALHAEENAIVNMARLSVSANLSKSTLYTTTYPCNLCANKIAQVGIKNIVYFEPYPQKEAKEILKSNKVTQTPFEGVTFNGYFRFMEVLR